MLNNIGDDVTTGASIRGANIMKTNRIVLFISISVILVSSFLDISYVSNPVFKMILLLYAAANLKISSYMWEKRIQAYKTDMVIEGINVYIVPFEYMKSHNALIFKGKKYNIVIDEETSERLSEEEINAVFYHEVGHVHTVSKELIMYIGLVGLFFSSTGLHDVLYKNSGKVYVLIGVGIFFLVEYLKRYIEYRADRYALKCGVDIRILESAVRCIEEMNSGNKIIISDHPKTKRRFKR